MNTSCLYYTYIVQCIDGSFYTGITNNIIKRVQQHNGILRGGAKYTSNKRPVKLVYFERYSTYQFAAQREYVIKKYSHAKKLILCNSFHLPKIKKNLAGINFHRSIK